jgi:hypothetical protein
MDDKTKERLIKFILKKVKENTSLDKPYYILKWSGLFELCKSQGFDLLNIIDDMASQGLIKKALLPTKKKDKQGKPIKLLAIALPDMIVSKKAKNILDEFNSFQE